MKNIISLLKAVVIIALISFNHSFAQQKQRGQNDRLFGQQIEPHNINPPHGIIRCASTEYEKYLQAQDPKRMNDAEFEAWINPLLEAHRNQRALRSESGGIVTIPVVVHVIHNGQNVGVAPNITDAQVQSQINVMNNDFRRMMGTPGHNTNPLGADTMIQFALAQQDPNGNPTNGINRVNLCQPAWSMNQTNSIVKPATQWDPNLYLNMWSVDLGNGDEDILGYAQFPNATGLPGLGFNGGQAGTDGVVCDYATFGSINYNDGTFLLNAPYNEGRTMTHEVGHWLGLIHIWGNGSGCGVDDFCADTPVAAAPNYECPVGEDSCPTAAGVDMIENYMDYTDDACMNIFTQNQKDRMAVIINNAVRRASLKTSTKDQPMALFANDAEVKVESACAAAGPTCGPLSVQKTTIFNRGTSNLTSATISYSVNGAPATIYTWTGNVAPNKSLAFDMPISSASNGPITMTVINANGGPDQRASNNTASGTYTAPPAPANHTFNNVVFRLQKDNYGSETSWNLKNSAGITLYSGGGYPNGADSPVITENWVLPSNQCYVFTINDVWGDGICCDFGDGFYDIKSPDGTVTIASGGEFGSTESKYFTINMLSNDQFSMAGSIQLYPNPTQGTLNIGVGSELGLPTAYTIYNTLGQLMAQKNIVTESDLAINTSAYSSGLYIIQIEKDSQSTTLRFIKE